MKLSECIKLSCYNIIRRKKTSVQIFLCFFIVGIIITSILLYSGTLNSELTSISLKKISESYVKMELTKNFNFDNSDPNDEWTKFQKETVAVYSEKLMEKLLSIKNVCDVQLYKNIILSDLKTKTVDGKETDVIYDFKLSETKLTIGGNTYTADNRLLVSEVEESKKSFALKCVDMRYSQFSEVELSEYELKNGSKEIFLCGGELKGENQIILSERILKVFGINPKEAEQLLGKKLSITVNAYIENNSQEMAYIEDYTICGVLKNEYLNLSRSMSYDALFVIPLDVGSLPDEAHFFVNLNSKSFSEIEPIKQEAEVKSGVSCQTSKMFESYLLLEKQNILTKNVFVIIGGIIAVSVVMFITLLFMFTVNSKSAYFGLLKSIGMSNNSIFINLLFEMLIIFAASFVISSCLSYIIVSQVLQIISGKFGLAPVAVSFDSAFIFFLVSFLLTVVLIFIITSVVSFNIRKTHVTDLLKG